MWYWINILFASQSIGTGQTFKHSYVKQVLPAPQLEAVKGVNVLTMYLNRRFNQVFYSDSNWTQVS